MSKDQSSDKTRFKVTRSSIIAVAAIILILFVAFTIRVLPMRWEIPTGQVYLNEFDPYYQYSITNYMVQNGLFSPYTDHWINYQQWYPAGLDMSQSLPALPMTAAALYQIVSGLGANIDLMTFCALLPPIIGALACLILYFIGKDIGGRAVGLLAALIMAFAPSFLQRSSLGFFDTEIPGVLGLLLFILMFLRSMDPNRSIRGSLIYSISAALALAYFISGWGAAYYILDLAALFAIVLVVLKRYDRRLLINYGITMGLGLLIATQVPYIGFSYLTSVPLIPVYAALIVLLVAEFMQHSVSAKNQLLIATVISSAIIVGGLALAYFGYLEEIAGKFLTVVNPSARATTPLIASVAEHRVTGWGNLYIELGIGIIFFLSGLYFTLKNPTNRNIFLLIFGATGLYFGASMIRLLVIFAPAFALLMGVGVTNMLKPFMNLLKEAPNAVLKTKRKLTHVSREYCLLGILIIFVLLLTQFAFTPQATGSVPRAISGGYTPTSIHSAGLPVIPPSGPLPQWSNMLTYTSTRLSPTDVVVAWWDYGYWLSVLGNVTTLADNATVNATQIENLGFAYMGTEEQTLMMLSKYGQANVKYMLVFESLVIYPDSGMYFSYPWGYGDEGKWSWMAKISGGAKDRLTREGFMNTNSEWSDETAFGSYDSNGNWEWNAQGMNSTFYKLMTHAELTFTDGTGGIVVSLKGEVELKYFKIVYIAGTEATTFSQNGDLVPLVALYEIDWDAYNKDHPRQ